MCSVQHIVFKWHTPRVCSERNVSQNMRKFSLVFCNLFRSYFAFFREIFHLFAKMNETKNAKTVYVEAVFCLLWWFFAKMLIVYFQLRNCSQSFRFLFSRNFCIIFLWNFLFFLHFFANQIEAKFWKKGENCRRNYFFFFVANPTYSSIWQFNKL